jgi:hypothetical protein
MPSSPKEYHEHANRCLALVRESSSHLTKAQLEYLAQTWMNLADLIDQTGTSPHWAVIDDRAKAR